MWITYERVTLDSSVDQGTSATGVAFGDGAMFGGGFRIVRELLCEAADPWPGQKVPDLATGSGNTALAARLFCEATDVDYVPAPLERGRERAATERLLVNSPSFPA